MFPFHNALQTFTFFVTPEYVSWLDEDSGFLQNALDHIFQDWSASHQKSSDPSLPENFQKSIELRVAVVDRIPFPHGSSSGCPGISLVASAWSRHYLKDGLSKRPYDGRNKSKVPLISFKLPSRDEQGGVKITTVHLRPANTLFANGLSHTMFMDRWVVNTESEGGSKVSRKSARESIGRITFNHTFENSALTLPMQQLTQKREILKCMGNVISKLTPNENSEATSASRELEESVSTFLKTRDAVQGNLAVFALLIPKSNSDVDSNQIPVISAKLLGYDKSRTVADEDDAAGNYQSLDRLRLALSQGAHLHRVTSGGGGWGKKEGLLSLEPARGFESEDSEESSAWTPEASEGDSEESRPFWAQSAVPGIVHPGDMVEFYGVFWSPEAEQTLSRKESLLASSKAPATKSWHDRTWAEADVSNIVLGVTNAHDSNVASTLSPHSEVLISVPHHFGMLSEHGMALGTVDFEIDKEATTAQAPYREHETRRTRIDVPHAVLTYSARNWFTTPANLKRVAQVPWRRIRGNVAIEEEPTSPYTYEGSRPIVSAIEAPQRGLDAPHSSKFQNLKDLGDHSTNVAISPISNVLPHHNSEEASGWRLKRATNEDVAIHKYSARVRIRKHNAGH